MTPFDDFIKIYDKNQNITHVTCKHCNQSIPTGIITISEHWVNCTKRTKGLIITKDPQITSILDKLSANVK